MSDKAREANGVLPPVLGRSEQELMNALQLFIEGKHSLRIPARSDDPDLMLGDAIEELVMLRSWRERAMPLIKRYARRSMDICFQCGGVGDGVHAFDDCIGLAAETLLAEAKGGEA